MERETQRLPAGFPHVASGPRRSPRRCVPREECATFRIAQSRPLRAAASESAPGGASSPTAFGCFPVNAAHAQPLSLHLVATPTSCSVISIPLSAAGRGSSPSPSQRTLSVSKEFSLETCGDTPRRSFSRLVRSASGSARYLRGRSLQRLPLFRRQHQRRAYSERMCPRRVLEEVAVPLPPPAATAFPHARLRPEPCRIEERLEWQCLPAPNAPPEAASASLAFSLAAQQAASAAAAVASAPPAPFRPGRRVAESSGGAAALEEMQRQSASAAADSAALLGRSVLLAACPEEGHSLVSAETGAAAQRQARGAVSFAVHRSGAAPAVEAAPLQTRPCVRIRSPVSCYFGTARTAPHSGCRGAASGACCPTRLLALKAHLGGNKPLPPQRPVLCARASPPLRQSASPCARRAAVRPAERRVLERQPLLWRSEGSHQREPPPLCTPTVRPTSSPPPLAPRSPTQQVADGAAAGDEGGDDCCHRRLLKDEEERQQHRLQTWLLLQQQTEQWRREVKERAKSLRGREKALLQREKELRRSERRNDLLAVQLALLQKRPAESRVSSRRSRRGERRVEREFLSSDDAASSPPLAGQRLEREAPLAHRAETAEAQQQVGFQARGETALTQRLLFRYRRAPPLSAASTAPCAAARGRRSEKYLCASNLWPMLLRRRLPPEPVPSDLQPHRRCAANVSPSRPAAADASSQPRAPLLQDLGSAAASRREREQALSRLGTQPPGGGRAPPTSEAAREKNGASQVAEPGGVCRRLASLGSRRSGCGGAFGFSGGRRRSLLRRVKNGEEPKLRPPSLAFFEVHQSTVPEFSAADESASSERTALLLLEGSLQNTQHSHSQQPERQQSPTLSCPLHQTPQSASPQQRSPSPPFSNDALSPEAIQKTPTPLCPPTAPRLEQAQLPRVGSGVANLNPAAARERPSRREASVSRARTASPPPRRRALAPGPARIKNGVSAAQGIRGTSPSTWTPGTRERGRANRESALKPSASAPSLDGAEALPVSLRRRGLGLGGGLQSACICATAPTRSSQGVGGASPRRGCGSPGRGGETGRGGLSQREREKHLVNKVAGEKLRERQEKIQKAQRDRLEAAVRGDALSLRKEKKSGGFGPLSEAALLLMHSSPSLSSSSLSSEVSSSQITRALEQLFESSESDAALVVTSSVDAFSAAKPAAGVVSLSSLPSGAGPLAGEDDARQRQGFSRGALPTTTRAIAAARTPVLQRAGKEAADACGETFVSTPLPLPQHKATAPSADAANAQLLASSSESSDTISSVSLPRTPRAAHCAPGEETSAAHLGLLTTAPPVAEKSLGGEPAKKATQTPAVVSRSEAAPTQTECAAPSGRPAGDFVGAGFPRGVHGASADRSMEEKPVLNGGANRPPLMNLREAAARLSAVSALREDPWEGARTPARSKTPLRQRLLDRLLRRKQRLPAGGQFCVAVHLPDPAVYAQADVKAASTRREETEKTHAAKTAAAQSALLSCRREQGWEVPCHRSSAAGHSASSSSNSNLLGVALAGPPLAPSAAAVATAPFRPSFAASPLHCRQPPTAADAVEEPSRSTAAEIPLLQSLQRRVGGNVSTFPQARGAREASSGRREPRSLEFQAFRSVHPAVLTLARRAEAAIDAAIHHSPVGRPRCLGLRAGGGCGVTDRLFRSVSRSRAAPMPSRTSCFFSRSKGRPATNCLLGTGELRSCRRIEHVGTQLDLETEQWKRLLRKSRPFWSSQAKNAENATLPNRFNYATLADGRRPIELGEHSHGLGVYRHHHAGGLHPASASRRVTGKSMPPPAS